MGRRSSRGDGDVGYRAIRPLAVQICGGSNCGPSPRKPLPGQRRQLSRARSRRLGEPPAERDRSGLTGPRRYVDHRHAPARPWPRLSSRGPGGRASSASSSRLYRSSFARSASTTLGRRAGDEALVREHCLGARDLLLQPRDLGAGVARRLLPLRPDDGREHAALVVGVERDLHAAAPEHHRRLLHAVERVRVGAIAVVRRRARRHDQAASAHRAGATRSPRSRAAAPGGAAPSSRSSAASAVAIARRLVLVQSRLDRLGVPVAEVVEREVVEHVRRRREVEGAPRLLDLRPGERRSGPGSNAPRAPSARAPARRPRRSAGSGGRRSRACSRACAPPRSRPERSARPGSTRS